MTPNDRIGPNAALLFFAKKNETEVWDIIDNSHSIDNTQTPVADTPKFCKFCPISLDNKNKISHRSNPTFSCCQVRLKRE